MTELGEARASWGRFLAGCALILVLIGAGVGAFWWLSQRKAATAQAVYEKVLQPYWDALPRTDFAEICAQLCTPDRLRTATPSVVAQRFADFTKAQGALQSAEVFSITEGKVIGQPGQTMRVVAHMSFANGRKLSLTYNLFRLDDQPWRIDSVTTKDRDIILPTF